MEFTLLITFNTTDAPARLLSGGGNLRRSENCYLVGGIFLWWGEKVWWEECIVEGWIFPDDTGRMTNFQLVGGGLPSSPPVGKTPLIIHNF